MSKHKKKQFRAIPFQSWAVFLRHSVFTDVVLLVSCTIFIYTGKQKTDCRKKIWIFLCFLLTVDRFLDTLQRLFTQSRHKLRRLLQTLNRCFAPSCSVNLTRYVNRTCWKTRVSSWITRSSLASWPTWRRACTTYTRPIWCLTETLRVPTALSTLDGPLRSVHIYEHTVLSSQLQ